MLTNHHIARGCAAALMIAVIGAAPALATPMRSSAAPIEYLEYDLTPYFNSMRDSEPAFQYGGPTQVWSRPTGACSTMRQVRSCTRHR
jgi:hypothetical protein